MPIAARLAIALGWRYRGVLVPLALALVVAVFAPLLSLFALAPGPLAQTAPALDTAGIPAAARPFVGMYAEAARVYEVSPYLLMAVHEDETAFGTSRLPGVRSGVNSAGCCAGPMQFSIATGATPAIGGRGATWEAYRHAYRRARSRPSRYPNRFTPTPNVYDSWDAILAAGAYFHALGAGPALDERTYQALVSYKGTPPASIPYARHDFDRALELQAAASQAGALTGPSGLEGGGSLAWPLRGPVTSPFGPRWGRLHAGIDISAPDGTAIYAADAGVVTLAGWTGGYGNYACLRHNARLTTCYAHMSAYGPRTQVGRALGRGALVGRVGNTGHSFGAHLHFETRLGPAPGSSPVNPVPYLQ